ncbi:MAG: SGNH/GDSL hydrolase family protein, partial [Gammaproteobacteria bacterium]|nr:SGNH/GDSL hydrolase family protein [Gammaproteobacteria bacterium]
MMLAEVGLRVVIYQYRSRDILAVTEVYKELRHRLTRKIAENQLDNLELPIGIRTSLYMEQGLDLLKEFQGRYEEGFAKLVKETSKIDSEMLVVYVPSDDFYSKRLEMDTNRAFFSNLCEDYGVAFLDVSDGFLEYSSDVVTLLPEDNHLSRFGNKIVAKEIGQAIEALFPDHRSAVYFDKRPSLLGDFRPNDNSIWTLVPSLPYRVQTNSQGLRMGYDLEFPKKRQRVLVLGDSITFGPFLDNHDTYPAMLNDLYPQREFVNAGVQGYTIIEQLSLFVERAKYVEPDVTILQVLDNDLFDFFYFRLNIFDREKRIYSPSYLEKAFLERLRREHTNRSSRLGNESRD